MLFSSSQKCPVNAMLFKRTGVFQLLGELLLDRHNFAIMTKYIGNAENLKLIMNCLRDSSKNIQFEAFHVFKVGIFHWMALPLYCWYRRISCGWWWCNDPCWYKMSNFSQRSRFTKKWLGQIITLAISLIDSLITFIFGPLVIRPVYPFLQILHGMVGPVVVLQA